MKKFKNVLVSILIGIVVIIGLIFIIYRTMQDENKFTVTENTYITENSSNLITINVINDANIFGEVGSGVYYDFLSSLEEEHGLNFNIVTTSVGSNISDISLTKSTTLPDNGKLVYTDHFVVVSKEYKMISKVSDITGSIGVLDTNADLVKTYLNKEITNYTSRTDLTSALSEGEVDYIIVPRIEYYDYILENLYSIDYHLSDIKDYYYINPGSDEVLNLILTKYMNTWSEENFTESFNQNLYDLIIDKLNITEKEIDAINSKEYTYGFIENSPYDIKVGGTYGGIMSMYLDNFSKVTGITFNYKEYSSLDKLKSAINSESADIYVNYFDIDSSYQEIDSNYTINVGVIMNNSDIKIYTKLSALSGEEVYVKEESILIEYLTSLGIDVKTYSKEDELKKLIKNNNIVIMDKESYRVYLSDSDNANLRFTESINLTYNFYSNIDTMFNRMFTLYTEFVDPNEIVSTGYADYVLTVKSGTLISKITKYTALIIVLIALGSYISYKLNKRVRMRKRLKKNDKMKYIDLLTSLKNRNFLNENISLWNHNTIYPQTIIVIDLNGVQELNDSYGYQEGDKQIQYAANALIKTQLDNSEIMRTDGNEFTIYLMGYTEKQILSYIKKLNKEFKSLPHNKGAAIGFSMITDDVKLIDDAINEATERMKENKAMQAGDANEKQA